MGKNQTHSAGAARSTKLPWGASDLKGHRQGVRKGLGPPPTVGPHEDPHLRVSTPAEESRRQVTPANREGAGLWDTAKQVGQLRTRKAVPQKHKARGIMFGSQNQSSEVKAIGMKRWVRDSDRTELHQSPSPRTVREQ